MAIPPEVSRACDLSFSSGAIHLIQEVVGTSSILCFIEGSSVKLLGFIQVLSAQKAELSLDGYVIEVTASIFFLLAKHIRTQKSCTHR
jgi:hypothetical protein